MADGSEDFVVDTAKTAVLSVGQADYLISSARLLKQSDQDDVAQVGEFDSEWAVERSNPYIKWIAGNFVESDKPNSNGQFWTAGDLEMGEYSIRHSPLNMVHKFRTPVGFFMDTRKVPLQREEASEGDSRLKIQTLAGMWSHIFPMEAAQVDAADAQGSLFFSMECRGTHLRCAGESGCGNEFSYLAVDTHCEHLMNRTSVRHIVNPTFRGGALIIPPVRPGWSQATATVVGDPVMQEAAAYAEKNEKQYRILSSDGNLTASAWEQMMALVLAAARESK